MPSFHDLRSRAFAGLYDRVMARHEACVRERKRALLGGLSGTVLELGPGTGASLAHLAKDVRWIGCEPNVHMHPALLRRAREAGLAAELRTDRAEALGLPDESVDAVLATLVLCSVPDAAAVLAEVRRVLRPGGRFVFLEHVAAPRGSSLRLVQRLLRPAWRLLGDGCTLDRETESALRAAGFRRLELEAFRLPRRAAWLIAPHVAGSATK